MRLDFDAQPVTDEDPTIRQRLDGVPVPQLLVAVAQLTGQTDLLVDEFRTDPSTVQMMGDDGLTPEQRDRAKGLITDALGRFRDAGCKPAPPPTPEQLRLFIEFLSGPIDDDHLLLFEEELALGGVDLREPAWRASEIDPARPMRVVVIGAGMSGIVTALRLRQAGCSVQVFEKNEDVGGTWLENAYPGCRVDVPNHLYSYSFAQSPYWPQFHSTQPVLLDYFRSCAQELHVADAISYRHEVEDAVWSDETRTWTLTVQDGEGNRTRHEADAVVSAVGQLNRPSFPDIAGIESFGGRSFHSARWDDDVDFDGVRVGVIGSGASAVQFIPWLAERASQLTVYQRTPPWLVPVPNYHDDLPENLRWVLRHVPEYARWDRLTVFSRLQEGLLPRTVVDPEWDMASGSVSAENDAIRQGLTAYYEFVFPDPDLRAKVLPKYPFGAKRMVVDSGVYSTALQAENVALETGSIAAIEPSGVRLEDGRIVEHDVIVYGTGFRASQFLTPMRIVGRNGVDLHERWGGDARAHLGLTVPGFPNLFLMYGPNTNIVVNGSIVYFSECQAHYIAESLRLLLESASSAMDCRPEAHDAYNERIDQATKGRAWGASDVPSWYKNEFGRVAQNWPFNLYDYWQQTRQVDVDDYLLLE
jgi:4-hydroxyacetophenone monooxygenase